MVGHVTVPVGCALPDAHGGQMRRLQRGHVPLVDGVVGDAVEADLAVRPWLCGRPFDAVVQVLGLARGEVVDEARRGAAPARIEAHAGVVVRHPLLRVHHLPALVLVGGARRHIGMPVGHQLPGAGVAVLEGEPLGIGAIAQDCGIPPILYRSKHVAAHNCAVVHGHRHVPVDAHAIARLGTAGRLPSMAWRGLRPPTAPGSHRILPRVPPPDERLRMVTNYGWRAPSANPIVADHADLPIPDVRCSQCSVRRPPCCGMMSEDASAEDHDAHRRCGYRPHGGAYSPTTVRQKRVRLRDITNPCWHKLP